MDVTSNTFNLKLRESNFLDRAVVIIPTFNARRHWTSLETGLKTQELSAEQVLIVDSSSSDDTQALAKKAGFRLMVIPKHTFGHGATRQMAVESLPHAEFLIFLTQDAVPTGRGSFRKLLGVFDDCVVGAAYGRQLPRADADAIERHARMFNYPPQSERRTFESRHQIGIRAAFSSNSFAAYRRSALDEVGGFPKDSIVSEEVTVVARMLMAGWTSAYEAEATVIHSHPFGLVEEFRRYFDIGAHHGREAWLVNAFGHAGKEGLKFVASEMKYLYRNNPSLIPWAALRTLSKLCGYQLGKRADSLPGGWKGRLSGQPQHGPDRRDEEVRPADALTHV